MASEMESHLQTESDSASDSESEKASETESHSLMAFDSVLPKHSESD